MKKNKFFEEELLEPVARYFRFVEGIQFIPQYKPLILADLGCGPQIRFYKYCLEQSIDFKQYLGIDPLLSKEVIKTYKKDEVIELIKAPLDIKLPLKNESVDYVVGFAFLEHIDNPKNIINDSIRVLKPKGKAIFTTPSTKAKSVLEFLSFKLGLISPREIAEHKTYFEKELLESLIEKKNRKKVKLHHSYFEFGMNNLFVLERID